MQQGFYRIFTMLGIESCLSVDSNNGCVIVPFAQAGDASFWEVLPIAGTENFYLRNPTSGYCAFFDGENPDGQIRMAPLLPSYDGFALVCNAVAAGAVAINNAGQDHVFDVRRGVGPEVIAYPWDGGSPVNQMWKFVPTTAAVQFT